MRIATWTMLAMTMGCTSGRLQGSRGLKCDGDRTWNLGTGRIEDIQRNAPGFFDGKNAELRKRSLPKFLRGIADIPWRMVDGSTAFEFVTAAGNVPHQIQVLRVDKQRVAIVATPGRCPRVTAIDRCDGGYLSTDIKIEETISCLGPVTVAEDHVLASIGDIKERLVFGRPLMISASSNPVTISIYPDGTNEPAATISNRVDDANAANLTAQLRSEIKALRVASVMKEAATVYTPKQAKALAEANPKGSGPGDDEVTEIMAARIRELLADLSWSHPEPELLITAAHFVAIHWLVTGNVPNMPEIESIYGPLLSQEAYKDLKYRKAFALIFPDSSWIKKIQEEQARDAREVATQLEREDLRNEVQGRGDEIATLIYKIKFGHQNFVKSRRNLRGLESMELYRQGLIRDAFCPAKRKLLKAVGVAGYQKIVTDHCRNEAPVDVGVGAVEVTLTGECREAFATGC